MTGEPSLAVVVVNYNAGPHLYQCLRSLREAAGDAALEMVVVDNASRDGSLDTAEEAFPEVRVIRLLNPDAEVRAGTLSGLVKVADEHPRAAAFGVLVRDPDGSLYPSARRVPGLGVGLGHAFLGLVKPDNRFSREYTMADWDRSTEREVEWVSGSAMLLRRAALGNVGPFDEGYFMYVEDVDLCTRLRKRGWRVVFTPEVEVMHVGGVSTGRSRRMFFEHARSAARYFERHRSPGALAVLRPFVRAALWLRASLAAAKVGAR